MANLYEGGATGTGSRPRCAQHHVNDHGAADAEANHSSALSRMPLFGLPQIAPGSLHNRRHERQLARGRVPWRRRIADEVAVVLEVRRRIPPRHDPPCFGS